jgi:uncharacterized repeat protein (TIGR01451 family)
MRRFLFQSGLAVVLLNMKNNSLFSWPGRRLAASIIAAAALSACGTNPVSPTATEAPASSTLATSTAVLHPAGVTSGADVQVSGSPSTGSPDGGTPIVYTFQVRNSGPETAAAVTLTDVLPEGTRYLGAAVVAFDSIGGPATCDASGPSVSCSLGSMPKGGSATVTVTVSAPPNVGTFSNTGTATSATADPNPGNNAATVTAQVKTPAAGGAACPVPAGQITLHGLVTFTSSISTPSGTLPQDFGFVTDAGDEYYVATNYYDGSQPLTHVINLDCKTSPAQFVSTGGFVTVTGTVGKMGPGNVPTFTASVVQVPTHKDKI